MAGASNNYQLLKEELIQRRDEGCLIPQEILQAFQNCDGKQDAWNSDKLNPLYAQLMALEDDPTLRQAEPNDLESIQLLRPAGPRQLNFKPNSEELMDRMHGALTARCVGCTMGLPVEHIGMRRSSKEQGENLLGRKLIKSYLKEHGDWPLSDYFSTYGKEDERIIRPKSCRDQLSAMIPDDDINYTIIALIVMEEYCGTFDWKNIASTWLKRIPISWICTAEAQAILNVQDHSRRGDEINCSKEYARRNNNPYREWIGAQIRSDGWAWACAGNPERAAEWAWRDASWTHERNGIYGAMFFAALQAAAFVESDLNRLIDIGLSEIPQNCRLAQWIQTCRTWFVSCPDFETCMDQLEAELQDMHVVHTINNALICLIGLYYGQMDLLRSTSIAVMCGLDTDCNGATIGSIIGAINGKAALEAKLVEPLNDTITSSVLEFHEISIKEMSERFVNVWEKLNR